MLTEFLVDGQVPALKLSKGNYRFYNNGQTYTPDLIFHFSESELLK